MTAGIRFERVLNGEIELNVALAGNPSQPLILFLHGFPEYWAAWAEIMERLADTFLVAAPDQRGFNLSSKPAGVSAYRVRRMVEDVAAVADRLSPGRPFVLAGHDWGASVAYAYAFAHPERLSHLVIANGPHPWTFQKAILDDPAQRQASQYINTLRADGMEERMAAEDFMRMERMLAGFSRIAWMTDDQRAAYRTAWSQPGAMTAMLNWYRASPLVVPAPGEVPDRVPLFGYHEETFLVRMPHLVIWGEADEALRPSCLDGLDRFAADLTIRKVPDAGHWILHERPDEVAAAIREFVG